MTHENFDDAQQRCTWVENGERCQGRPVIGSPTTSSCEAHRLQSEPAPPSIPLTPEESISAIPD
jgi:hypothetical protein